MAKHIEVSYSCDNCEGIGAPNQDSHEQDPWPKGWNEMSIRTDSGRSTTNLLCTGCSAAVSSALKYEDAAKNGKLMSDGKSILTK